MKVFEMGEIHRDEAIELLREEGEFMLDGMLVWLDDEQGKPWVGIGEPENRQLGVSFPKTYRQHSFIRAVQKHMRMTGL